MFVVYEQPDNRWGDIGSAFGQLGGQLLGQNYAKKKQEAQLAELQKKWQEYNNPTPNTPTTTMPTTVQQGQVNPAPSAEFPGYQASQAHTDILNNLRFNFGIDGMTGDLINDTDKAIGFKTWLQKELPNNPALRNNPSMTWINRLMDKTDLAGEKQGLFKQKELWQQEQAKLAQQPQQPAQGLFSGLAEKMQQPANLSFDSFAGSLEPKLFNFMLENPDIANNFKGQLQQRQQEADKQQAAIAEQQKNDAIDQALQGYMQAQSPQEASAYLMLLNQYGVKGDINALSYMYPTANTVLNANNQRYINDTNNKFKWDMNTQNNNVKIGMNTQDNETSLQKTYISEQGANARHNTPTGTAVYNAQNGGGNGGGSKDKVQAEKNYYMNKFNNVQQKWSQEKDPVKKKALWDTMTRIKNQASGVKLTLTMPKSGLPAPVTETRTSMSGTKKVQYKVQYDHDGNVVWEKPLDGSTKPKTKPKTKTNTTTTTNKTKTNTTANNSKTKTKPKYKNDKDYLNSLK